MVSPARPYVFLFIGDESSLKEEAIKDLSASLLKTSHKELDYKVFYGDESDSREILDYATTFPFLSEKKLVLIKKFEKLPQGDRSRLIDYIKKPSKFTCLIIDTTDASVMDDLQAASKQVKVLRFDNLTDSEISSWIKKFLASRGKRMEARAFDVLKELQGNNLLTVAQELEKLTAFTGKKDVINTEDVERLVGKSLANSVFDLAWAISERKTDKALKLVDELIRSGRKTYEIIGLLYWHFKRVLKAKVLQAKGETDASITAILRINRRYASGFFREVNSCDIIQIRSKIEALLDADLNIKRARFSPVILLELAVIKLCLGEK